MPASPNTNTAPYPIRLRLAIAGLTIAWSFSALFFVLALRALQH